MYILGENDTDDLNYVPFIGTVILRHGISFTITAHDAPIRSLSDGDWLLGRQIEMRIIRQASARAYALLIFVINWLLSHFACGLALSVIYRSFGGWSADENNLGRSIRILGGIMMSLYSIPVLRKSMPDAPGYDGKCVNF